MRQLRDENRRLRSVVADLTLDKTILQEALRKNVWSAPVLQLQAGRCRRLPEGPRKDSHRRTGRKRALHHWLERNQSPQNVRVFCDCALACAEAYDQRTEFDILTVPILNGHWHRYGAQPA